MAKAASKTHPKLPLSLTHTVSGQADAIAVGLFEKTTVLPSPMRALDAATGGALSQALALGDFRGKAGSVMSVPASGQARRAMLVGLGRPDGFDLDQLRWAAGAVSKAARAGKFGRVVLDLHSELLPEIARADIGQAIAEGVLLGGFVFDEFKSRKDGDAKAAKAPEYLLYQESARDDEPLLSGLRAGVAIAESANDSRRIAYRPGNVVTPAALVAEARALARRWGLKIRVIDAREATRLGMGGLVAVGQGSAHPPALILLEHGAARGRRTVAVVGKAVTFDTGGISIKPAADMDAMKYDKCGGVAVLGIMQAVARLKLPLHVVGVIPAAENAVGSSAYRPGDILRMYNGTTVEITNTDAEGRLILADALAYAAEEYDPAVMIDMATLTGGVVVALGSVYAGLMANNDALAAQLEASGRASGELLWRLPLHERYKPLMDGTHADLHNSGGREAHPIQGGVFLQRFVPAKVAWAHLDIAGTAHPKKDDRYLARGASGFGVRLVVDYLRRQAAHKA